MKKTFAQLKRDIEDKNISIKTLYNYCKEDKIGQVRTILKTQTNAIVFNDNTTSSGESWLWWPKASLIEYEDNIFKIYNEPCRYNNFTKTLAFTYEFIR